MRHVDTCDNNYQYLFTTFCYFISGFTMDAINDYLLLELAATSRKLDEAVKIISKLKLSNLTLTRQNQWLSDQWDIDHHRNLHLAELVNDLQEEIRNLRNLFELANDSSSIAETESDMSLATTEDHLSDSDPIWD